MLAKDDIKWLAIAHPRLQPSDDGKRVEGSIQFTGAYSQKLDKFTLVGSGDTAIQDGVVISTEYRVTIRENENIERLPKLFIHDNALPHIANRHFYPQDESACVCGVIEEARRLKQGFSFTLYLEELVVPFLYGQKYYDDHGVWPWRDYAHDTAGALEAYFFDGAPEFIPEILKRLSVTQDWTRIKKFLLNKDQPKGHLPCFCVKQDHFRRCHPDALAGLRKLYTDIKLHGIEIREPTHPSTPPS